MAEFRQVMSDEFDFLGGKSIYFLEEAAKSMRHYLEVPMALQQARMGAGRIYQVFDNAQLLGCFFMNFITNHIGKTMNLILLGGENMKLWADDLSDFLHGLAEKEDIDELTVMGRPGFKKLFPNLEHFACVYRQKRERLTRSI